MSGHDLGFPDERTYTFPNIVNVEVYRGTCPCRCVHCPVGRTLPAERESRFGSKAMSLSLFEKIVHEMAGYSHSALRIHSVGEPLLWNGLIPALEFAQQRAVKTWVFTSAVTEDVSILKAMCACAGIIEVSVNSISAEDYRRTKGIDAFVLVKRNVELMHSFIAGKGTSTRLIVSRVQSARRSDDDEFVAYWKSSGVVHDAFVRTYHTYNDLLSSAEVQPSSVEHQPCLVHWARFNVSVDGDVVVCFNELFRPAVDPSLVLGDVARQSIAEIWHGPRLTALRAAELTGDYSRLDFRDALPCKDCRSCQPLRGGNQTSEYQVKRMPC